MERKLIDGSALEDSSMGSEILGALNNIVDGLYVLTNWCSYNKFGNHNYCTYNAELMEEVLPMKDLDKIIEKVELLRAVYVGSIVDSDYVEQALCERSIKTCDEFIEKIKEQNISLTDKNLRDLKRVARGCGGYSLLENIFKPYGISYWRPIGTKATAYLAKELLKLHGVPDEE